jgi:hypothetical protein
VEELTEAFFIENDEDATNYLRGKLWSDIAVFRKSKDTYSRRGAQYLSQISEDFVAREPSCVRALARCYRFFDYKNYRSLFRKVLDSVEPERRPHELIYFLEATVNERDWDEYVSLRKEWDQLPVNASFCECYINSLYTFDGLHCLGNGNSDAIPELLLKAVDVAGCPHLNSGASEKGLIKELIDRQIFLPEARAYLEACREYYPNDKQIEGLMEKIT